MLLREPTPVGLVLSHTLHIHIHIHAHRSRGGCRGRWWENDGLADLGLHRDLAGHVEYLGENEFVDLLHIDSVGGRRKYEGRLHRLREPTRLLGDARLLLRREFHKQVILGANEEGIRRLRESHSS